MEQNNNEDIQMEIVKCAKDPIYFIFKHLETLDLETNEKRKFGIFKADGDKKDYTKTIIEYIKLLEYNYKNKRKLLVYKRRQLYITTATIAWLLWHFLFDNNFKVITSSEKLVKVDNPDDDNTPFQKIRDMYNNLPEYLQLDKKDYRNNTGFLANTLNNNTIVAEASDNPGRAGQASVIWGDEFAFQPRTGTRYTSMLEACKGMILLTSTPNGKGNKFYELYTNKPDDMDILDLPVSARRTDEWIAKKRESYKGNEAGFEQEIMGSWESGLQGRAFTYYSTSSISKVTTDQIKKWIAGNSQVYIGLDQGWSHPSAAVWLLKFNNKIYLFDDYAANETAIEQHSEAIKRKNAMWGIKKPIIYADPSMFTKNRDSGRPAADTYRHFLGIPLTKADNRVEEGTSNINILLAKQELEILPHCILAQDALAQARYPVNQNGYSNTSKYIDEDYITDVCDSIRYALTFDRKILPKVINPSKKPINRRAIGFGNLSIR